MSGAQMAKRKRAIAPPITMIVVEDRGLPSHRAPSPKTALQNAAGKREATARPATRAMFDWRRPRAGASMAWIVVDVVAVRMTASLSPANNTIRPNTVGRLTVRYLPRLCARTQRLVNATNRMRPIGSELGRNWGDDPHTHHAILQFYDDICSNISCVQFVREQFSQAFCNQR